MNEVKLREADVIARSMEDVNEHRKVRQNSALNHDRHKTRGEGVKDSSMRGRADAMRSSSVRGSSVNEELMCCSVEKRCRQSSSPMSYV